MRWARTLLVLFGLAAGLAGVEVALRWTELRVEDGGLRDLHELRLDRPWLFGLRSGADVTIDEPRQIRYRINADGFRDLPRTQEPEEGTFRVVVLGDSVAFGYAVERAETFSARLEALLTDSADSRPVEVLNLGVNGYNPYLEAALFRDVGIRYHPDLVLAQFCVNDLNDPRGHFDRQTLLHLGVIPEAAYPEPPDPPVHPPRFPALLRACRASRVCSRLDDAWVQLTRAEISGPESTKRTLAPQDLSSTAQRSWLATRYGEIAREADQIGAAFAVVAVPYRHQVDGEEGDDLQRRLAALGEAGGWPTLDLLPAFRGAAAASAAPLFVDLWHPTAEGHAVAARALAEQLRRLELVPGTDA